MIRGRGGWKKIKILTAGGCSFTAHGGIEELKTRPIAVRKKEKHSIFLPDTRGNRVAVLKNFSTRTESTTP